MITLILKRNDIFCLLTHCATELHLYLLKVSTFLYLFFQAIEITAACVLEGTGECTRCHDKAVLVGELYLAKTLPLPLPPSF